MRKRISDTLNNLDDAIVAEASVFEKTKASKKTKIIRILTASAACLVIVAGAFFTVSHLLNEKGTCVTIGGVKREYKGYYELYENDIAFIWPWEYLEVFDKYNLIKYNSKDYYILSGKPIDKTYIGQSLGIVDCIGYDENDNQKMYTEKFEVFRIKEIKSDYLIAVCMENEYYICKDDEYNPPATFKTFVDMFGLNEKLELRSFGDYASYSESGYYTTENNGLIWDILLSCKDAENIPDKESTWTLHDRKYISFTVNSEVLGVNNQVFSITEDGYIYTNLFHSGYIYNIGKETANKIIDIAKKDAVKSKRETYSESIVGKVTEIGKDYFLVDDTVLCADEKKGMVFRVDATQFKIWRYIDSGQIEVGDIVSVEFKGDIDVKNGNRIDGVFDISTSIHITEDGYTELY